MKTRIQYFITGVLCVIVDNYVDIITKDISFKEATDSILSIKGIIYALLLGLAFALLLPRWYKKRGG
jgi:hypothetical protein